MDISQERPTKEDVNAMATFESTRLLYRAVRMSDLEAVMPILASEETMQWTSRAAITDREEAEQWLKDRAIGHSIYNFAMFLKQGQPAATNESLIGLMGVLRCPEIGYMLHPDHFRQGYATEALQRLLPEFKDKVFSSTNDHGQLHTYIEAFTDVENVGSRKILERCGFVLIELRENAFMNPTLGLRDTAVYRSF